MVITMSQRKITLMPKINELLKTMGEQIKIARLRRKITASLVAERAGVSRATVWHVEKGDPGVAIGIYAAVLHALNGLDKDLLLIAKDDDFGRKMDDLGHISPKRVRRWYFV